jgi:hypothetical protein
MLGHALPQWFSTTDNFAPMGTFDNAWKHFDWMVAIGV